MKARLNSRGTDAGRAVLAISLTLALTQLGCELGTQPIATSGGSPIAQPFLNNSNGTPSPGGGLISVHWNANHEGAVNSVGGGYLINIVGVGHGLSSGNTAPTLQQLPPGVFPGVPIRYLSFGGQLSPDPTTCGPLACFTTCILQGGSWSCPMAGFPLHNPWVYIFTVQAFGSFNLSSMLATTPPGCVYSGPLTLTCTSAATAKFSGGAP